MTHLTVTVTLLIEKKSLQDYSVDNTLLTERIAFSSKFLVLIINAIIRVMQLDTCMIYLHYTAC